MAKKSGVFVSRQHYYYGGNKVVEVELNGLDYAGPDMLVNGEYPGECKEYDDPREAINVAIAIRDAWRKDMPGETIDIALGSTQGMGMEIEATEKTDEELREWAQKRWDALPKCDRCGELIVEKWGVVDEPDCGDFCSENCVQHALADAEPEPEPDDDEEDVPLADFLDPRDAEDEDD